MWKTKPIPFGYFTYWTSTRFLVRQYLAMRENTGFELQGISIHEEDDDGPRRRMGVVLPATYAHVKEAVAALKHEHVIALPTDTLYGFAADACSPSAIQKIYDIKGRNLASPLAICVACLEDLGKFSITRHLQKGLLEKLLPGPVTLILPRGEDSLLDKSLNPGLCSIGIRIPDSPFICQVADAFGGALALTSANPSGQPSTICVQEFEKLWHHCAYIFDGGNIPSGHTGSTIVDLTKAREFKIIRAGSALQNTVHILKEFGLSEMLTT